jgi:hypothetical protein
MGKAELILEESNDLSKLAPRLVFSLFRAAVHVAARFRLPLDRFLELARLAYFEHLRVRSPRDLKTVAESLGVTYRTAVNFNRKLRGDFLLQEQNVEVLRRIAMFLRNGDCTVMQLYQELNDADADNIRHALTLLIECGWVTEIEGRYRLQQTDRSYLSDDIDHRVDALNHQMEIFSQSVWQRFVDSDDLAAGRTWVFEADPERFAEFISTSMTTLRQSAVAEEEHALRGGTKQQFAITCAFTPLLEENR